MNKFSLTKDKFRVSRGNYSRFLNIYCNYCGNHIVLYQKDGSGPLKRLYLDRIFAPKELLKLKIPSNLVCKYCRRLIGIPSVYEKENRAVYLITSDAVVKKIERGVYPPKELKISVD